MKSIKGTVCLLAASVLWGAAFVAQASVPDTLGSFAFNAARGIIASLFLLAVIFIRNRLRKRVNTVYRSPDLRRSVISGAVCGSILFAAANLQQFGIASYPEEAAASGRSGFLTATYVVMVAVYTIIKCRQIRITVLLSAAGCMVGMYLLCLAGGPGGIYSGDLLILLCAAVFGVYVLYVDRCARLDGIIISCVQFAVCGVLSLAASLLFEHQELSVVASCWLPILYTGICSSGMGYTLQIIGQKYSEPAAASIIMSLESVFAALSGWLMLNERLGAVQIFGCVLMFAAVVVSQLPGKKRIAGR